MPLTGVIRCTTHIDQRTGKKHTHKYVTIDAKAEKFSVGSAVVIYIMPKTVKLEDTDMLEK